MIAVAKRRDLHAKNLQRNQNHEDARMGVAIRAVKRAALGAMTVQRAVLEAAQRTVVVQRAVLGAANGAARKVVLRAIEVALEAEKRVVLRAEKRAVLGAGKRAVLGAVIAVAHVRGVVKRAMVEVVFAAEKRVALEVRAAVVARVAVGAVVQVREAAQAGVQKVADAPTVAEARAVGVAVAVAVEVEVEEVEEAEARTLIRKSGASCLFVALVERVIRAMSAIQTPPSLLASGKCWETKCATAAKIALEGLVCSSTLKVVLASQMKNLRRMTK